MVTVKFLWGEPALLMGKNLIVSDLHIGIEYEYWQAGIKLPSQTEAMKKRLDSLLKETKARSLLICGDFKHKVPGMTYQEQKEIPAFLEHFSNQVRIEIAPGNHDADLRPLLPQAVKLHSSKGFLKDGSYYTHGHTWPDPLFLTARFLIIGHIQPQIEIKDKLGYTWREPVWVRVPLSKKKVQEKYKTSPSPLPELIILPSFNPMVGGLALNKKEAIRESPLLKLASLKKARITMLDGTFLGELRKL